MLCLLQGQSPTVLQDIGGAALVKAFPRLVWSLPSPSVSSASRHSNPSLALCLAVVLTVYLVPSFLVAPLAQICAPVAHSPLLPSSTTSCASSGLGSAMWIPTKHPAQCDSTVPLVIGGGAPFHSVTWHSHGTIAGTCAGGGGVPKGVGRPGLLFTTAGPWHSVHGTNEALKNEVQVPYQPECAPAALNLQGGAGSDAQTGNLSGNELPRSQSTLRGISIHPQPGKGSERNWTQADCKGSGFTSAQLQIFWGSGHHRLTYPYRHSESAIALIPMYNSGIDPLRRLKPNMDQSC